MDWAGGLVVRSAHVLEEYGLPLQHPFLLRALLLLPPYVLSRFRHLCVEDSVLFL